MIMISVNVLLVRHRWDKDMNPEQEMIEGLKLAAYAGAFIGLAALAIALRALLGA